MKMAKQSNSATLLGALVVQQQSNIISQPCLAPPSFIEIPKTEEMNKLQVAIVLQ